MSVARTGGVGGGVGSAAAEGTALEGTAPEGTGTHPAAGQGQARPVLSVDNVTVSFGGRVVLDSVSFTVAPGEFTGLIGPNGAGKTTLLRVILGLQRPTQGTVATATNGRTTPAASGTDARQSGQARRHSGQAGQARRHGVGQGGGRSVVRSRFGYVPQKVLLDPDMPLRARDLVALGLDGHRFGVPFPSRARAAVVEGMLSAVDALRFADARVGTLSGGEQQRVLIAHALISQPQLLLLDEPLANLDLGSAQEIITLLARLARDNGVAVLLSAHEMNPLLPVMDRVVYLAGGRAASGTTDEVIRPEVLSRLYGHHVDVIRVHGRVLVVAAPGSPEHAPLAVTPTSAL